MPTTTTQHIPQVGKSSFGVYLQYWDASANSGAGAYTLMTDIKDFPDLGGEPEMLQTTTLSDKMHTYIMGIQSSEAFNFTANLYWDNPTADGQKGLGFLSLKEKGIPSATYDFRLVFANGEYDANEYATVPTGVHCAYWSGQFTIYQLGKGVDEVLECQITITPSTVITYDTNPHA